MATSTSSRNGTHLKMIGNSNNKTSSIPVTPNTLAKLEDPRAWHARGEVGIVRRHSAFASKRVTEEQDSILAYPMAPPIPRGRAIPAPKKVLEEEEYVDRLGDIIESDYFPHNAKMTRALAGLGGTADGVTPSAGFIATPASAGFATPGGSTPVPGDSTSGEGGQGGSANKGGVEGVGGAREDGGGGALTRFVAMHTSEDNEAFAELQEKDQEAFRRRYFWAYDTAVGGEGNSATAAKLLILPNGHMMSVNRREEMDAACADRPKIGDHRPNQVETWKHRTRNQLMFLPNLAASNDTCRIEQAPEAAAPLLLEGARSATKKYPQSFPTKDRPESEGEAAINTGNKGWEMAFGTEEEERGNKSRVPIASITARSSTSKTSVAQERLKSIENDEEHMQEADNSVDGGRGSKVSGQNASIVEATGAAARVAPPVMSRTPIVVKTNPKVIQAKATRFPVPKAIRRPAGAWASPIESPSSSRESVKELLVGRANGDAQDYAEVPMTPSRVPGLDGDSPQITWGSIDGTPMILDPRMTPLPDGSLPGTMSAVDIASVEATLGPEGGIGGRQFEVKDLPARDKLAHRLEAEDTRRKRARPGPVGTDDRGTVLRTPGSRTPGSRRTPSRTPTPATGRRGASSSSRSVRMPQSPASATLTPAGRMLAAKLAQHRGGDTPFGGMLTPGPQKKRRQTPRRGAQSREGLTPLPGSTPGSTPIGGGGAGGRLPTPVVTSGKLRGARDGEKKTRSSLTDGLLSVK